MRFLHVSELLPTPAGQFQESLGRYYRVGRGCDNGSGLTGRARRASEGSRAFPSLARRVRMQKHAELPCRGNIAIRRRIPCLGESEPSSDRQPTANQPRCQAGEEMAHQFVRAPLRAEEADRLANACRSREEKLIVWTLLDTG